MGSLRFGLWYDFRNPPRWAQDPTALYSDVLDQVERAEALGFDDVWLSEHHFIEDGYCPSLLPVAAAIAARTERIRIGTAVLLLPLHDPIRVAEVAALVDVLSGGRFDLGVGLGYRVGEFEGFGVRRSERVGRAEEGLVLLRRLLGGERVDHDGRYYHCRGAELRPLPVQKPLPLWVGGFVPAAAKRAARLADGYLGASQPELFRCYRDEVARLGGDPDRCEAVGGFQWLLVARDPAQRWREARDHFAYQIESYQSFFREERADFPLQAADDEALRQSGVRIVEPAEAVDIIAALVEETAITRYYAWTLPPGLPASWSDEHLELMASEVMPALRGASRN
jgi:alkanesulfonate monooxygenase SsuD/methylene tetrahydromethanopterin reductase-like flavin-dependent oxidoreductase (luciferase family)